MIRFTITIFISTLLIVQSFAQEFYGKLELSPKNLKTIQRFVVGDTVAIFFREGQAPYFIDNWILIRPGETRRLILAELAGKEKVAVMRHGSDLLFYFAVEEKKQLLLKVLTLNVETNARSIQICTVLPDNLLVTTTDRTLVFLYRNDKNKLGLMEIDRGRVVRDVQYTLPIDVFERNSEIAFIDEGALVTAGQASQPLKIYRSGTRIMITHDVIDDNTMNHKYSKTVWITIETGSGQVQSITIPEPGSASFKSIWYDGLLYKIFKDKGFHVKIYDGEKPVHGFSIPYTVAYADNPGMLRDDVVNRVFNNRNVRDVMDNTGKPFMVVEKVNSVTTLMKLGTQKEVSKGYSPLVPSSTFVALIASLAVSSVSHAVADESSIHHYFYVKGNFATGFEYTSDTALVEQKIDEYELFNPETKIDYRYKSYLRRKGFTVAFYMREKGKQVEVLSFK